MEKKEHPKVSVVIPVYNTSKYMHQCLDTVCGQTLREIEIICVDDGSSDNSVEILEEYAARDERVHILHHPHKDGIGAAGARNMGIEIAQGEYIIFLDSDDYFDLELLEKTYNRAKECDADIVMYDAVRFDNNTGNILLDFSHLNKTLLPKEEIFTWRDYPEYFFQASGSAPWTQLIRRKCIMDYQIRFQEVYHLDDFFFTYATRLSAERVTILSDKLVYYRNNNDISQTANMSKSPLSAAKCTLKMKAWLEEQGLFEKFKRSFFERTIVAIKWYFRSLPDINRFSELFNFMQESGLKGLGLLDASKDDFVNLENYEWCRKIGCLRMEEYLLWELTKPKIVKDKMIPRTLKTSDRVVLYGAGAAGRTFFIKNIINKCCQVVQWVDRDYMHFAEQVESPDKIGAQPFDKVIIAVENEVAYRQIVSKLQSLGVENERIIWLFYSE